MRWVFTLLFCSISAAAAPAAPPRGLTGPELFKGTCDASAACVLDNDRFVVASDEDNQLRIYSISHPGKPVSTVKLWDFLGIKKGAETDLEGAARRGNRIYWIASHGRNSAGEESPHRRQFFATDVLTNDTGTTLAVVEQPCHRLLSDLLSETRFALFGLNAASQLSAKEQGGLNIEGLSRTAGESLLIGFRSPVPEGKALLIPIENPEDLLRDKPARFGDAIRLDLNGLGIRSIDYHEGRYLIIAGDQQKGASSRIYIWNGDASSPRWAREIDLSSFNPESTLTFDSPMRHFVLSDDGGRKFDGKDCKDLKDAEQRWFRSYAAPWSLLD